MENGEKLETMGLLSILLAVLLLLWLIALLCLMPR